MVRVVIAAIMNATVPGSGLILLGRAWLGFAVAVWFCLATEIAISGKLVAPATTPWGISVGSLVLAVLAWLLGQGLFISRIRDMKGRLPAAMFAGGESDR